MTHHEDPQATTHPEQEKTILPLRVLVVVELDGVVIVEHRPSFLKGDAVLPLTLSRFFSSSHSKRSGVMVTM